MDSTFLGIFHPRLKVETEAALKGQGTPGAGKHTLFDAGQTSGGITDGIRQDHAAHCAQAFAAQAARTQAVGERS
ncbi:hypothetical protein B9Z31_04865 [Limnohabitans sp. G3-2]|nr:hypothetical protein B9Z31_04865 [Limnohabitans sp. G3-2]